MPTSWPTSPDPTCQRAGPRSTLGWPHSPPPRPRAVCAKTQLQIYYNEYAAKFCSEGDYLLYVLESVCGAGVLVLVLPLVLLLNECSPRSSTTRSTYNHHLKKTRFECSSRWCHNKICFEILKFRSTFRSILPHPREKSCDFCYKKHIICTIWNSSGDRPGSPGIAPEVESGAAGRRPPSHAPWPG